MMGTVFATPKFQDYRGGIIEMEGHVYLDMPHSISIVGMDRIRRCFKIQNSYRDWGVEVEGESVGWIRYELVFDILQAGYVYEDIPLQRHGPGGSDGPCGSGSGPRGSGSGRGEVIRCWVELM